jgi:hypothetical protein
MAMQRPSRRLGWMAAVVLVAAGCGDDGDVEGDSDPHDPDAGETASQEDAGVAPTPILLSPQNNDLVAYATEPPFDAQVVIRNADAEPGGGLDINGQVCFDPDDPQRFVAGEDTDQGPDNLPGWGIFEISGDRIGELDARQVARLVPTYQTEFDTEESPPENYGCAWLPDGRVLTTDIGNQATGDFNGQLIIWFPPFDVEDNDYCKIDVELATAQALLLDGDWLYVAEARRAAVSRYPVAELPTGPEVDDGCGATDATGAPLTDAVTKEPFIQPDDDNGLTSPSGLAQAPDGRIFVSSVINGVISEFDADGTFRRMVLAPDDGDQLGAEPLSVGTPLGIEVAPDGTLYYADIGIVISDDDIGPGPETGTVRRIVFSDDDPLDPEVIDEGLSFPDGLGVYLPPGSDPDG